MPVVINGDTGITQSGEFDSDSSFGYKNRLINGRMEIDQRNAGASVTPTVDAQYGSCDRWSYFLSQASKFSVQQNAGSVTPPAGFTNYLGVTSLSAYTLTGGDNFEVVQKIEGYNVADLGWGTASAQTVTLSFWVRSSLTGTFGGAISNGAYNRSYPFAYTINAANTWEQKTVTIPGDTTGTWLTTTGQGLALQFALGATGARVGTPGAWTAGWVPSVTGATSVVSTNGATWYITGVQLEKGSTATSFDFRSYGTELVLCQRYCLVDTNESQPYRAFGNGTAASSTVGYIVRQLPVPMRTTPSVTASSSTLFLADVGASAPATTSVVDNGYGSTTLVRVSVSVASGFSAGQSLVLVSDGLSSRRSITYSAEL